MNDIRFEIGKPEGGWLCTATNLPLYDSLVSQNSVSYWCYVDKYGFDIKIAKNTVAGHKIEKLVNAKASQDEIELYLVALALRNMTPEQFVLLLKQTRDNSHREGRNDLRRNFLALLSEE